MGVARRGPRHRQRLAQLVFLLLIAACVAPFFLRGLWSEPASPHLDVVDADGRTHTVTLHALKDSPSAITRSGRAQNQYGNWRDDGIYTGVPVIDLIGSIDYASLTVVAEDGYQVTVSRTQVEDPEYPMILAFAKDGVEVPAWNEGFRLVVLPEDGGVSNAEYGAESAGSYWVKNAVRIVVIP